MPEGLAKSAEPLNSTQVVESVRVKSDPINTSFPWEGIPPDIFHYFNLDMYDTPKDKIDFLRRIVDFAKRDIPHDMQTGVNLLARVFEIERHAGIPRFTENKLNRVYTYVKLTEQISELENVRKNL